MPWGNIVRNYEACSVLLPLSDSKLGKFLSVTQLFQIQPVKNRNLFPFKTKSPLSWFLLRLWLFTSLWKKSSPSKCFRQSVNSVTKVNRPNFVIYPLNKSTYIKNFPKIQRDFPSLFLNHSSLVYRIIKMKLFKIYTMHGLSIFLMSQNDGCAQVILNMQFKIQKTNGSTGEYWLQSSLKSYMVIKMFIMYLQRNTLRCIYEHSLHRIQSWSISPWLLQCANSNKGLKHGYSPNTIMHTFWVLKIS